MQRIANTESTDNAPVTLVVELTEIWRLYSVEIAYSAEVTLDVLVERDSGLGVAYDVRLATMQMSDNRWAVYIAEEVIGFIEDDILVVTAPAGGAGITSAIVVYGNEMS